MAVINHSKREINAKIVYYGPSGVGKGSLFSYIHQRIKPSLCGPLKSMPAGGAVLQFFDYIPFERSSLDGYRVRFHLYTLTGPVDNPATWKMTLKGVDGLAIVAEAGAEQGDETVQSLQMLHSILASYGMSIQAIPFVLLNSKADMITVSADGWGEGFNGKDSVRTSVVSGVGVLQALAVLSQGMLQQLRVQREMSAGIGALSEEDVKETGNSDAVHDIRHVRAELPVAVPVLLAGETTTIRLPVTFQVAGETRSITLRVAIGVEEEVDGVHVV